MNKKLLSIIVISTVLLVIGFYFTPYFAVHNMKKAAESKDAAKISSYIDFPALKESLKANFNALIAKEVAKKPSTNGFEALGMALAAVIINPMIDALVTPESLAMMMEGEKPLANNSDKPTTKESRSNDEKTETSLSYESFNTFLVKIKKKDNTDEPVGFVFTREGLIGWKLTALRLPNMNEAMSAVSESASPEAQSNTVMSSEGHESAGIPQETTPIAPVLESKEELLKTAKAAFVKNNQSDVFSTSAILEDKYPNTLEAKEASMLVKKLETNIAEKEKQERLEMEKQLAKVLGNMNKTTDEMQEVVFYTHKNAPKYLNSRSFLKPYIVTSKTSNALGLRLKNIYVADDWLFIESYRIKVDDVFYDFNTENSEIERDNGDGNIWEWEDKSASSEQIEMLKAIASSKKSTIRYIGRQYYKDRTISEAEKKIIKETLLAFEELSFQTSH